MKEIFDNDAIKLYSLKLELGMTGHITNSYILIDKKTNDAMLIDPAYNAKYIISVLNELNVNLKIIYLTHCHGDHIAALEDVYKKYSTVTILIHKNDKDGIFDDDKNCKYIIGMPNFKDLSIDSINTVSDNDVIKLGETSIDVIHTPGHTNGSSVLYIEDANILITGDTIFSDCHGRTDLNSGSMEDMKNSLKKIFDRFTNQEIYPGHGISVNIKEAKKIILK